MSNEKTPKKGEDISEDERLGTAVQKFIQRPEFSAFERLICSYLVQGITGAPLDTIIYTMRAAMTLDEERLKILKIDKEEVESIYAVAQIINTATKIDRWGDGLQVNMRIGVDTLDWDRDIAPWIKRKAYPFTYIPNAEEKKHIKELKGSPKKYFNYSCMNLSVPGYRNLEADFLRYAMPKSQEITKKLSEIISPSTYIEIFRLFTSPQIKVSTGVGEAP